MNESYSKIDTVYEYIWNKSPSTIILIVILYIVILSLIV